MGFDCVVRYFDGSGACIHTRRRLVRSLDEMGEMIAAGMRNPRVVRVTVDLSV